jgi:hypothetical protein
MPVLPTLESSQSVFTGGTLAPQQIQSSPADFGGLTAQAGEQLGAAAEGAGNNIAQTAAHQAALQNEATANDAYVSKFSPQLRGIYSQYYALQGKDAVDQLPVFQQKLQDLQDQQRDQLANPYQQQIFDQVATRRTQMELDGMGRYADTQNKVFQQQTSDGMVKSFQQQASDKYNDPIVFNGMVNSITAERTAHAASVGQPIEYAKAQIAQDVSGMWSNRLQQMAQADPVGAYDMLSNGETWSNGQTTQHTDVKSQIDPAMLPSLEAHLLGGAKQVMARNIAHASIYGSSPIVDPAHLYDATQGDPPLTGVVQKLEGGTDAQGNSLTSPAGAQGSMQVMPATQTNPGYGVTPAKDNSPAEIARVGRDYLGAMTARYQDPALTLAAYNAGPGAVDDWLNGTNKTGKNPGMMQLPDPRSGQISDADFAAKVPFSETRAYVGKGLAMVQQPGDKPTAMPTTAELKTTLPQTVETARAAADRMFPNDPTFSDAVAARTAGYGNTILQGVTATQQAAVDTITRAIIGTKPDGSDKITSMDGLMANPAAKAAWSQATPEAQLAIQTRLARPAAIPLTQDGLNKYYQLRGQAANDPNGFMAQDLSTLYGKVPDAQIMELINQQSSLSKSGASKTLQWSQTKGDVDDMLKPLGLGQVAKTGTDQSTQTEQFYGKLQEQLEQYHAQNQKYPDTVTTRKMAAGLLAQGTQGDPSMLPSWLGGNKSISAFQSPDLSKFEATIPDEQKPALTASFQKVYGRAPTDAELGGLYTKFTLAQKGGK